MANRGLTPRIPIRVRLPVIIALVLAGIFMSPMVLDAAGVGVNRGSGMTGEEMDHTTRSQEERRERDGGGHGPADDTDDMEDMDRDGSGHRSGDETGMDDGGHGSDDEPERGGGHGSGDETEMDDGGHGSGDEAERTDH